MQVLDKLLNLTEISIFCEGYFTNRIVTMLLKHADKLKALSLQLDYNTSLGSLILWSPTPLEDQGVTSEKLLELSKLINLETIELGLTHRFHIEVNDEVILNILQNCPKIIHIKLGKF